MSSLPIDPTLVAMTRRFEEVSEGVPEHLIAFPLEQVAFEFDCSSVEELVIEIETRMALGWLFAPQSRTFEEVKHG